MRRPAANRSRLSPDGSRLAVLRATDPSPDPADTGADLVVTDRQTSIETVVAHDLDESDTLHWTADGRQLFATEYSYGDQSMRIGRFDAQTRQWEIQTVPFGAGLAAVIIDPRAGPQLLQQAAGAEEPVPRGRRFSIRAAGRACAPSGSRPPRRRNGVQPTAHARSTFPT